jgi:gamma-butyrobetaine dioxygenase
MMSPGPTSEQIAALFEVGGADQYLGEPVTQAEHMRQSAWLAEESGAPDHLVAAALLHDVGHFCGDVRAAALMSGTDNAHQESGAAWLSQWFGPEVTEPVRLHVDAKRYLCATEPAYLAALSPASIYTLGVQGGQMSAAEAHLFAALAHAGDAVALRRLDDQAKVPGAPAPSLAHFFPLLERLATRA